MAMSVPDTEDFGIFMLNMERLCVLYVNVNWGVDFFDPQRMSKLILKNVYNWKWKTV